MPVVDVHTHLLPPDLPRWKERFGYGGFIRLEHTGPCRARMLKDDGQAFREVEETLWVPAARIADCDRLGNQISRGARTRGHDGPFPFHQSVKQRRLPHIWPADNGQR